MPDPRHTLQQIGDRLAQGDAPTDLTGELLPKTRAEAVTWARRLPLWEEHRSEFGPRAVAVARIVSKRAMRQFGLVFDAEGRVVEESRQTPGGFKEPPAVTFPLTVGGEVIEVRY